jgi:selenocysteine-specific elongation factor
LLLSESVIADARRRIQDEVTGYHHAKPLEPGMPLELLRRVVASSALADAALDGLVGEGQLVVEGGLARKRDFSAALTGDRSEIGETIRRELETAGAHGRTAEELSQRTAAAREVAEFLVRQGTAVRIGSDRYYERRALEALRDEIVSEVKRRGRATPAELRDRTGLTRKFLIPVLEWLDGAGFTVREGDARRPGPAARSVTEGA